MRALGLFLVVSVLASCATTDTGKRAAPPLAEVRQPVEPEDPAPRPPAPPVLIRNATVLTAAGARYAPGYVLMRDGKIEAVGAGDGVAPPDATVVDANGEFVTPGIIDIHSHAGVFPLPSVSSLADGNERSGPVTGELWAEHSFWPQDPGLRRLIMGGVTTIQVLPGSTNLVGGRSFVAKLHPATSARAMRFPGARQGLKMACGENPKYVYGRDKGQSPGTRMAVAYGYRRAFQQAHEYRRQLEKYERDLVRFRAKQSEKPEAGKDPPDPPEPPPRDFNLETLVKVLNREIDVHFHCYRADEMSLLLDLADEFGFEIRAFHHALEAYKIADRLAAEGVGVATWSDWWGFKLEAFDGIPQNAALVAAAGGRAIIHSDSVEEARHLNQEAAKALAAGRAVGLDFSEDEVLRWITANPAWGLGVADRAGTLEPGKMADVVIWQQHPFSVYALVDRVYIDGELTFDRRDPCTPPRSDFELGQPGSEVPR
jgi:imidazolonepropionase-like amidohydrolase